MSKDIYVNGHLDSKISVTSTADGGTKTTISDIHGRDIFGLDRATINTVITEDKSGNVIHIDDRKK